MKIAYLWGGMNRGGAETLLLDMFENAETAPFDFIGIHRKGGNLQEAFYNTSPTLHCCHPAKGKFIGYFRKLRALLKSHQVTVVHAQQFLDCVYAKIATIGTGLKVVQTFHGYDYDANWWSRLLIRVSLKWADANCFVSNQQKQYYQNRYRLKDTSKLHIIYNGINFSKLTIADCIPNSSILQSNKLKMAMVGNFVSVRNPMFVCRFLNLLQKASMDFDFYFIGKKNDKEPWIYDDCVAYCHDNGLSESVHFMGSRNDVPYLLKQMDAFVYCSDHDTFGIAVIEAIAAGIPTFVNDWPVMLEVTHNGAYATIYPTDDEQALLQKFLHFSANQSEYKAAALNYANNIKQLFSIQQHQKALKQCYSTL